ncbi:MAG: hypothetical protein OEY14_12575 [Myxococcales bacterium]|nr:hypothetical protein [Myxococcales bacterium]
MARPTAARRLAARLREPRGLAWLFGATLLGALALAISIATHRSLLEPWLRETQPAPSASVERLAWALARGEANAERLRDAPPRERAALYAFYLRASQPERLEALPPALFAAHPRDFSERVRRTLVAGSGAQRERALRFARLGCHRAVIPILRWASERAHRRSLYAWGNSLDETLWRVMQCSSGPLEGGAEGVSPL